MPETNEEVVEEIVEETVEEVTDEIETTKETEEVTEEVAEVDEETDEVVVTIGDDEPEEVAAAPEWVRQLRKDHRVAQKRIKELEHAQSAQEQGAIVVGKEPSMDDPDIDYDAEKFKVAMHEYYERKRQSDEQAQQIQADQKKQGEAWQNTLDNYGESKQALNVKDFEDAESSVQETLSETQQNILLHGMDNPALVVYALGKNPAKAKEIAGITDNVKFAVAIAKLEASLKVGKRTPASKPEKAVSGTASITSSADKELDRLREEARKSGNISKVIAYKKKMKAQG